MANRFLRSSIKNNWIDGFWDGCLYAVLGIVILFGAICILAFIIQFPMILFVLVPMIVTGVVVGSWRAYWTWREWYD